MYKTFVTIDRYLTKAVEALLALMFIAIFIMVFYQVVLRYVFSTAILGTAEVFTILFAYSSALGSAVMLRYREHIKISVFIDLLPHKARRIVLAVDYVLIAVFSAFIVYQSIGWLSSIDTFRSPVTGISRSVQSMGVPIGFALIIFYCLLNGLSLFLNPEEEQREYSVSDAEAKQAIEEARLAEERYRAMHADEETER